MRLLLAFTVAVAALAQQQEAPVPARDVAAPEAVRTSDPNAASPAVSSAGGQAQQAPATDQKAVAAPAPPAEQWFTGSLDLGYQWLTSPAGSFPEYRSVVNLRQGLVLNGLDFTITDPKRRLFDRLDGNAYGWGGDPYDTARLRGRKQGIYDFTFDYRNIAYFDAVPVYANPFSPAGFNEQSFDTHIRTMSVGLDLRPGKRIIPYLVFEHNAEYGNGIDDWTQDSNNAFPIPTLLRDSTNDYRGGVRFEYTRFQATLEQGGSTYKDDDLTNWSGADGGDRTSPIFGQTLLLSSLQQAYGIRGTSIYSKGLLTAHPFSWVDVYGQFLFSEPKTTVNFNEAAAGNFLNMSQLLFYANQQTMGTGAANQPHTTGTVALELRPFRRVRILQNWMTDRYHDAAFGMLTIAPSAASGSGIGTFNPLQVVNFNQEEVDILYDVIPQLNLRGGYRRIWGNAETEASPFFYPGGAIEQGQLKRNVAIAGLNFRPAAKASLNLEYENGTSDQIYFRDGLNDYQKARARMKFQLGPSLSLQANLSLLNNLNHAPSIQYDFLGRSNAVTVFWSPKNGRRISVMGEYDRSTVHSTIDYLTLPFFSTAISDYRDNSHTLISAVNLNVPGPIAAKLSLGGSMLLSSGSRNARYYQPLARLSFPLGKHLSWNTEWKYYGYEEDFYLYESFRTHVVMTGLKVSR